MAGTRVVGTRVVGTWVAEGAPQVKKKLLFAATRTGQKRKEALTQKASPRGAGAPRVWWTDAHHDFQRRRHIHKMYISWHRCATCPSSSAAGDTVSHCGHTGSVVFYHRTTQVIPLGWFHSGGFTRVVSLGWFHPGADHSSGSCLLRAKKNSFSPRLGTEKRGKEAK